MYTPRFNEEHDQDRLLRLMRENSFATLITVEEGVPVVTHLPFMVEEDGDKIILVAHLARANRQWQGFDQDKEVLVIFQGAHAYISPKHYDSEQSVPTWNYAVVHAYGVPQILTDDAEIKTMMRDFIRSYEVAYEKQWEGLTDKYRNGMLQGIVPFKLEVKRLQGKFKLSQNKNVNEQKRIVEAFGQSAKADIVGIAKLMEENLEG